jgi:hypothetical protein
MSNTTVRGLLAALLAAAAAGASAQKPAEPVAGRYADPHGYVTLEIPDPASGRKPSLSMRAHKTRLAGRPAHADAKTYAWDKVGRVAVPTRALISEPTASVLLIGTRGETPVGLGQLEVRAFDGHVLADLDLRDTVPGLAEKSAAWAKADAQARGAAPWLVDASLLPDGIMARLTVAGGATVMVNLHKLTATLAPTPAKP